MTFKTVIFSEKIGIFRQTISAKLTQFGSSEETKILPSNVENIVYSASPSWGLNVKRH